jgi:hypothetical protein
MYLLISAIAKPLNGDGRWKDVVVGDVALHVLFSTYSRILATLSHPFLTELVSLDLELIRPMIGGGETTFNEFLIANGNASLPTSNTLPVINPRYVKYADGFHAGYKITPVHPTAAPDAQLTLADKPWLHLTRPDTDYNLFYKSCLVLVNGFFHLTDAGPSGVYVQNGMKSSFLSGHNQLGICSFRELGELSFIPIKPEMVYRQNVRQKYKDLAMVDLGVDVSNKTVMLVLGGYLHILDRKTFYRTSKSTIAIDMGNLPLLDRYYESRKYLDFSSLPLEKTSRNDSQIDIANFFSDENLLAYLTLSQSFFVILDNPDVFINKIPIASTVIPNEFIAFEKPLYPLVVGIGKTANYWYTHEDGQYAISTTDSLRYNRLFDTVDARKQISVSDSCDPENPVSFGTAHFLQIGCEI